MVFTGGLTARKGYFSVNGCCADFTAGERSHAHNATPMVGIHYGLFFSTDCFDAKLVRWYDVLGMRLKLFDS